MSEQVQNLQNQVAKLERENRSLLMKLKIMEAAARILSKRGKEAAV